jgi:hypothetical protein
MQLIFEMKFTKEKENTVNDRLNNKKRLTPKLLILCDIIFSSRSVYLSMVSDYFINSFKENIEKLEANVINYLLYGII